MFSIKKTILNEWFSFFIKICKNQEDILANSKKSFTFAVQNVDGIL